MADTNMEKASALFERLAGVVQFQSPIKSLVVEITAEEVAALESLIVKCERMQWYVRCNRAGSFRRGTLQDQVTDPKD